MPPTVTLQAVGVLHYRTFESYFCWAEKHGLEPIYTGNELAEILCMRVLQSLCEHVIHCPERISQLVHGVFADKVAREGAEGRSAAFELDLRSIHEVGGGGCTRHARTNL